MYEDLLKEQSTLKKLIKLTDQYKQTQHAVILDDRGNIDTKKTSVQRNALEKSKKITAEINKDKEFKYNTAMEQNRAIREDVSDIKFALEKETAAVPTTTAPAMAPATRIPSIIPRPVGVRIAGKPEYSTPKKEEEDDDDDDDTPVKPRHLFKPKEDIVRDFFTVKHGDGWFIGKDGRHSFKIDDTVSLAVTRQTKNLLVNYFSNVKNVMENHGKTYNNSSPTKKASLLAYWLGEKYSINNASSTPDKASINNTKRQKLGFNMGFDWIKDGTSQPGKTLSDFGTALKISPNEFFDIVYKSITDGKDMTVVGEGYSRRQPSHCNYCVTNDGKLGEAEINVGDLLHNNILHLMVDGECKIHEPVDKEVVRFLTKQRLNQNDNFSDKSKKILKEVVGHGNLEARPRSEKFKILSEEPKVIDIPNSWSKKRIVEELKRVTALIKQGNGSNDSNSFTRKSQAKLIYALKNKGIPLFQIKKYIN